MTAHLGDGKHERTDGPAEGNARNGTFSKTELIKSGPVETDVPRDLAGSFEPVVGRHGCPGAGGRSGDDRVTFLGNLRGEAAAAELAPDRT